MAVTKKDVHYIANLARLQLKDDEAENLKEDMNKILGYVETLNELDTSDVEPLEHVIELTASSFRKYVALTEKVIPKNLNIRCFFAFFYWKACRHFCINREYTSIRISPALILQIYYSITFGTQK